MSYQVGGVTVYYAGAPGAPRGSRTGAPVNFEDIKRNFNTASGAQPWQDLDFPPSPESVGQVGGDSAAASGHAVPVDAWLRPFDIIKGTAMQKPYFAVVEDALQSTQLCSAFDIKQGKAGDCWYMASLQALTSDQDKLKFAIPADNFSLFDADKYCGAFHFLFYDMYEGKWLDIVVDDLLPCTNQLPTFASLSAAIDNPTVAEFWPCLIEKAYAKFIGSWAKIEGGFSSQGLENFTGGFSEISELKKPLDGKNVPPGYAKDDYGYLKRRIVDALKQGWFIGVDTYDLSTAAQVGALSGYTAFVDNISQSVDWTGKVVSTSTNVSKAAYILSGNQIETDPNNPGLGFCPQHAYSVLDAQEVKSLDGQTTYFLVKMRNPHAEHEWMGPFSNTDDSGWAQVDRDLRSKNASGSTVDIGGTFWVELANVVKYCQMIEFCLFGLEDGTKFTSLKSKFPAQLQQQSITLNNGQLQLFSAFKFEVKPTLNVNRGGTDLTMAAFTVVLKGYHCAMKPAPSMAVWVYKINDVSDIPYVYQTQNSICNPQIYGREASAWTLLEAGTYILVPQLQTAPAQDSTTGQMVSSIPVEYVNNDIEFCVRLYTENDTTIEEIPPQPQSSF